MTDIIYFPKLNIVNGVLEADPRDPLDVWRSHRHGVGAIAQAVSDLHNGVTEVESFVIAESPGRGQNPGKIHQWTNVAKMLMLSPEGDTYYTVYRYCGGDSRKDPDGYNSYSVVGSGRDSGNPILVAATLAQDLLVDL